jgi:predicted kinase
MQLIVFAGLPSSGKSSLVEDTGRELGIPVFDKDWIESPLWRCKLQPSPDGAPTLGWVVIELMTILAERQLRLGQGVILDSVARTEAIRSQ